MNWKDRKIVFVPGCVLCPAFQASLEDKNLVWQQTVIDFLVNRQLGILQMPCPEASFGSYQEGVSRGTHGIGYYERLSGFLEHCNKLGQEVVGKIKELTDAGYEIVAVIGIEHSPTCAANYIYTNHGMEKRKGIYISVIRDRLIQKGLDVPIMGVNRRYPSKFVQDMGQLLESKEKLCNDKN